MDISLFGKMQKKPGTLICQYRFIRVDIDKHRALFHVKWQVLLPRISLGHWLYTGFSRLASRARTSDTVVIGNECDTQKPLNMD